MSKFDKIYKLIMEEINNNYSILIESTGLTNRKPGEIFISLINTDDKISFNSIQYLKSEDFKNFIISNNIKLIDPKNNISNTVGIYNKDLDNLKNDKIIILALFTDLTLNEEIGFAKYVSDENAKWKQSDTTNSCFSKMYSYIYAKKAGQYSQFKMSPSDLIGVGQYNINDIVTTGTNNINNMKNLSSDFKNYLISLLEYFSNDNTVFPEKELSRYQIDYICNVFGEILGSIAILHHKIENNNNEIFNKINEQFAKIEFNKLKNDKLIDFNIICNDTDETIIGVSSKNETGGRAAITGLMDRLNSLNENIKQQFLNEITIFNIINNNTQYIGPIKLLSFLFKNDNNFKKYFQESFNIELTNKLIFDLFNLYNKGFKDLKNFNPSNEIKKIKLVNINAPYNDFYNIIAGITKCIVQYLNKFFKFDKFINKLLQENFIQIHLFKTVNIKDNKIILKNISFKIKNLKNIEYNTKLNSGSNYQSNKCQGKIKFEINSKKEQK